MKSVLTQVHGAMLVASCLVAFQMQANAQIVVDWATQSLVSYPQIVNEQMNVNVVINNANDLLFHYKAELIATPRTLDDGGSLLALSAAAGGANAGLAIADAASAACTASVSALNANVSLVGPAVSEVFDPTRKDSVGKYRSLQETIDEWNIRVKNIMGTIKGPPTVVGSMQNVQQICTGDLWTNIGDPAVRRALALQPDVDSKQRRVDGLHQVTLTATLQANNDYQIKLTELIGDGPTATATGTPFTATFRPKTTLLTLSLGTLLTEIQQRSYATAKDPTNTAQNILSVSGSGRYSPLGLALLNYEIPKLSNDVIGLTLSSGLALRFGSSSVSASSLGWFGGAGLHFYHRLFVAAGVHVGQFSDFPPGLQRGSVVPSNYGNLTGPNSSTSRFAFAITYQTKKFTSGSTTPKTQQSATQQPAAGGAPQSAGAGN